MGGKRTIHIRVGTDKIPVEIDERTTARDKRESWEEQTWF